MANDKTPQPNGVNGHENRPVFLHKTRAAVGPKDGAPYEDQPPADDGRTTPSPHKPDLPASTEPATNDDSFESSSGAGSPAAPSGNLPNHVWDAINAPHDLPRKDHARRGLFAAIECASGRGLLPAEFVTKVQYVLKEDRTPESPGATSTPLSRRTGDHRVYRLMMEVGARTEARKVLDPYALAALGLVIARCLLGASQPSTQSLARLRAALVSPEGRTASVWRAQGPATALTRASAALRKALVANPRAAWTWGLAPEPVPDLVEQHPFHTFNRGFRRRYHNLIDYSTRNAVAGAAGYGSLSANALRAEGRELANRVRTGDPQALLIGLQLVSHLPGETQLAMPVSLDGAQPPPGTLAWIDLRRRLFYYVLFRLCEEGARPLPGTEDLYERTRQVVAIALPPLLAEALERMAAGRTEGVVPLDAILGRVALHPRSGIDHREGYRVTVRRLQEALSAHLVSSGMHRWVVALALNSQFLAPSGRRAYGVCPQNRIDEAVNVAYALLGWTPAPVSTDATLIGSFVTPRGEAIAAILNALADQANYTGHGLPSYTTLVDEFNAVAEWLAALLALTLALRKEVRYELAHTELVMNGSVRLKHKTSGPPIPVCDFLALSIDGWRRYRHRFVARLRALGDSASHRLAQRIEDRSAGTLGLVFNVNAIGELQDVGYLTWHKPQSKRAFVPNFGRHFWPLKLMQQGVGQLATNVLMRHHLDALPAEGSGSSRSRTSVAGELRDAMNATIDELGLRLPAALVEV